MVQIYYEITIYIYKEIFPSGALPPNPPMWRGNPLCTPHGGGVYILLVYSERV
jgi:hypothetical protein